ncbi:MAG: biotin--[acetyl-CoA-carboxylase] ligase [Pacificimonas sp.]
MAPLIKHLTTVDSTNDWIAARAAEGAADGIWVRADEQTAGRGRRARAWVSEPGNLYASTLVRPGPDDGPAPQLSFVAALALHDMASRYVPAERLTLKWPNDLLLDNFKCAGILLEGQGGVVIIGLGINLAHHPERTERPATSFPAQGLAAPEPGDAVMHLANALTQRRALWRDEGFAAIRDAWQAISAHAPGERLEARLSSKTITGAYAGLADDGALILAMDDAEIRRIDAGDIFPV